MTYLLGVNCVYHETSACLVRDGRILAAIEEERLSRFKHGKVAAIDNAHELPIKSIDYCLKEASISLADVSFIGISFLPEERLKNRDFAEPTIESSWGTPDGEQRLYESLLSVPQQFEALGFQGQLQWLPHHICHLASSFYLSPFPEAIAISIDGIGEVDSTVIASASDRVIQVQQSIRYPHSIGFLWEKMCKFLGFGQYDAYKVMGLASYGDAKRFLDRFSRVVSAEGGSFTVDHRTWCFRSDDYDPLQSLFGVPKREAEAPLNREHQDLAASLQRITNETILHIVEEAHQKYPSPNLCLSGGVALNCVSNSYIFHNSPLQNLYIPPVANDAGTSIGAALHIWHEKLEHERSANLFSLYMGPEFSAREIEQCLREHNLTYQKVSCIEETAARLLQQEKIVGWFQGKMEIGPRALGNRSLLADPRAAHMRDVLNSKVKLREEFRPFAPSVLEAEAPKWFDMPKRTPAARGMLMTYNVQPGLREKIPAVVHVDGTSRIQLVSQESNARYYRLIKHFYRLTDVPMVLNTSFNCDEPIVCTPEDAIRTFRHTTIDYLALGDFLVAKEEGALPA